MRRVHDLVAFCGLYELEDVVAAVTGADRVEIDDYGAIERARRVYRLARGATRSRRFAAAVAPRAGGRRLTRDYDLFFPVFNDPFEIFALAAVPDWRARCRFAACFVCEPWAHELPEYLLELLAPFDCVFIGMQHAVARVARIVGAPCCYLPLAVDVLRFAPHPRVPRLVDVCNIGRRSAVTHAALMRLARERRIFYYHDTVRASGDGGKQMTFHVGDSQEHRLLLASLLQRTRYYVANRARVNEPENGAKEEISARFYEGIAAGAVLLGEAPRSAEFGRQFDWPDAVVPMPFDAPDAGEIIARLDADPARVERIRRENVRHAAMRHDWLHRLQGVFATAGLDPTDAMKARAARLRELSEEPCREAPAWAV
jgi:hypothetical protein